MKVLATSRAPLGVPEERVYRVPALELPDPSRRTSIARLRRIEAVRLFVDRARAARPDFELSETNAEPVVELCVRLDGLPLALELAAARSNLLSPRALLERLDSRLDLLRAAPGSGLTERQWTLRGAIEWSYELLEPAEQQLFTSLASSSAGSRWAPPSSSRSSPTSTSWRRLRPSCGTTSSRPNEHPATSLAWECSRRSASTRSIVWRRAATARPSGVATLTTTSCCPRRPSRACWPTATRVARASRRRAGQHPRCTQLGGGSRRGGRRPQDRRGALALLAAAEPRAGGPRADGGPARARLRRAGRPGEGANPDRKPALNQGDLETAQRMLEESLEVHRRDGDDRMVASALGLLGGHLSQPGTPIRPSPRPGRPSSGSQGGPSLRGVGRLWQVGVCLAVRGELDDAERTLEEAVDLARKLGDARSVGRAEVTRRRGVMRGDRAGPAPVRREPGHQPEPGRPTRRLALSLTPRVARARGG